MLVSQHVCVSIHACKHTHKKPSIGWLLLHSNFRCYSSRGDHPKNKLGVWSAITKELARNSSLLYTVLIPNKRWLLRVNLVTDRIHSLVPWMVSTLYSMSFKEQPYCIKSSPQHWERSQQKSLNGVSLGNTQPPEHKENYGRIIWFSYTQT